MRSRLVRAATGLLVSAAAAAAPALAAKRDPAPKPALPFIENDYPAALKSAKASGRPLFVEVWAPW